MRQHRHRSTRMLIPLVAAALLAACSSDKVTTSPTAGTGNASAASTIAPQPSTAVTDTPAVAPDKITYGSDPSQYGELWTPPDAKGPLPVVVLIHGGFWRAQYGLDLMNGLARDLIGRGFAVWNLEYRRVGQDGGGYPGTLSDVATGIDSLSMMAMPFGLDLSNVVVVGHSAGGQLALWAAGRKTLPDGAPGAGPLVVPRLAIGEGPVFDLAAGDRDGLGGGAVTAFIGGTLAEYPDRYAIATPAVTSGVPLAVVRGGDDDIVPAAYAVPDPAVSVPAGAVNVVDVDGADHFALIDPTSTAWAEVITLLGS